MCKITHDVKMESSELRQPTQKRAIEKREKILKNGFQLICKKGLHNTDAKQIAEHSGVSIGTVYQYFKDKHDIFIQGLKKYAETLMFPISNLKDVKLDKNNLRESLQDLINIYVKSHKMSKSVHEEIVSLQHTDKEVSKIFKSLELKSSETFAQILIDNGIVVENIEERTHLILSWIDHLCHEITYHKHKELDYDKMTELVIDSIFNLL